MSLKRSVRSSVSGPFPAGLTGPSLLHQRNSSGRPCPPGFATVSWAASPNSSTERSPRAVHGAIPAISGKRRWAGGGISGPAHDPTTKRRSGSRTPDARGARTAAAPATGVQARAAAPTRLASRRPTPKSEPGAAPAPSPSAQHRAWVAAREHQRAPRRLPGIGQQSGAWNIKRHRRQPDGMARALQPITHTFARITRRRP